MTFIASVRAKDGIAIIADSLVTSQMLYLDYRDFDEFIKRKTRENNGETAYFSQEELSQLFLARPSHTQDYEKKLFRFDTFTAITTAGNAIINEKRIFQVIEDAGKHFSDNSLFERSIDDQVELLASFLNDEARKHVEQFGFIGETTFILSHYDPSGSETKIFRIYISRADKNLIDDPDFALVHFSVEDERFSVVCDGQNRISERILLGEIYDMAPYQLIIKEMVKEALDNFEVEDSPSRASYIESLVTFEKMHELHNFEDINIFKLKSLSLQQAVDLASLLMQLEMNFQKYTKLIPTVGGVIRIATIDENGFKYVSGDEIIPPQI